MKKVVDNRCGCGIMRYGKEATMCEAIERLLADTFTACQIRGDTTMELMCIEEIARLMGETKR